MMRIHCLSNYLEARAVSAKIRRTNTQIQRFKQFHKIMLAAFLACSILNSFLWAVMPNSWKRGTLLACLGMTATTLLVWCAGECLWIQPAARRKMQELAAAADASKST
jgi:hypothetical protein